MMKLHLLLNSGRGRVVVRYLLVVVLAMLALTVVAPARGQMIDQAKPGMSPHEGHEGEMSADEADLKAAMAFYSAQKRADFDKNIKLDEFQLMSVQDRDQLKIMDSWARQALQTILHRQSFEARPGEVRKGLLLALDIALRPQAYWDQNIIYVESVPLREQLGILARNEKEADRIRKEARVSPAFLKQKSAQELLETMDMNSNYKKAVDKVLVAMEMYQNLGGTLRILPPTADQRSVPWVHPAEVIAQTEVLAELATQPATAVRPPIADMKLPAYTAEQKLRMKLAYNKLVAGWQGNDVASANQGLAEFVRLTESIDPEGYPPLIKRKTELWYNRTFSGTLVAFLYFTAMVLFLLVALGASEATGTVRKTGLGFLAAAVVFHLAAMGVRWWISGRIPIQNQFESVMGSACLGCLLGLLLETRWLGKVAAYVLLPAAVPVIVAYFVAPELFSGGMKGLTAKEGLTALMCVVLGAGILAGAIKMKVAQALEAGLGKIAPGIFGGGFAFVGFLATTILMAAPWVFGTDLGAAPGKVAGILNTGWLYIHVNIVIASYALITASAGIALVYLGLKQWYWVNPLEPGFDDGATGEAQPRGSRGEVKHMPQVDGTMAAQMALVEKQRTTILENLDQANMVVLQMAFWMLGVGILCGAVWADQSWGRPWGWDPKETFALVTWIVYLVIVHVRLVMKSKALTTSILALVGFGVMLFNYIGVNFFLVGLHSYA